MPSSRGFTKLLRVSWVVLLLAAGAAPAHAARGGPPVKPDLIRQSAFVDQGGVFELVLDTSSVPDDARVQLVVRDRVLSRTEFGLSVTGDRLRTIRHETDPGPFAEVDGFANDEARFEIAVGSDRGQARLNREGVYPVEVRIFDAGGVRIGGLVTHLVLLPDPAEEPRPIAVALVTEIGLPPALDPDGQVQPTPAAVAPLARSLESLATHPDVPLSIAARPETLERFATSTDADSSAALAALRDAVPGRQVVALPYVDIDVAGMLAADLGDEIDRQLARGSRSLSATLGVTPDDSVWLAEPTLDPGALEALTDRDRQFFVVDEGHTAPIEATGGLSLTRTFALPAPGPSPVAAKADPVLSFRILDQSDPELSAHIVLAELSVLSLEEPTTSRGVVIRPPRAVPPVEALDVLLDALATPNAFVTPVTLDQFFGQVEPLAGVETDLTPAPRDDMSGYARDLRGTRDLIASYGTMTGNPGAQAAPLEQLLVTGAARGLSAAERSSYVATARDAVTNQLDAVTISDARTITLTDRMGSVPLTIRNDSGAPLDVVVTLDSERLEFPGGDTLELTLTDEITRVEVAVNTRASGSFQLGIAVSSPDGALELAATRVTIRSTAVSGVGVFLSIGALITLVLWWLRDWRTGRRDRRLVERRAGGRSGGADPQPT